MFGVTCSSQTICKVRLHYNNIIQLIRVICGSGCVCIFKVRLCTLVAVRVVVTVVVALCFFCCFSLFILWFGLRVFGTLSFRVCAYVWSCVGACHCIVSSFVFKFKPTENVYIWRLLTLTVISFLITVMVLNLDNRIPNWMKGELLSTTASLYLWLNLRTLFEIAQMHFCRQSYDKNRLLFIFSVFSLFLRIIAEMTKIWSISEEYFKLQILYSE